MDGGARRFELLNELLVQLAHDGHGAAAANLQDDDAQLRRRRGCRGALKQRQPPALPPLALSAVADSFTVGEHEHARPRAQRGHIGHAVTPNGPVTRASGGSDQRSD